MIDLRHVFCLTNIIQNTCLALTRGISSTFPKLFYSSDIPKQMLFWIKRQIYSQKWNILKSNRMTLQDKEILGSAWTKGLLLQSILILFEDIPLSKLTMTLKRHGLKISIPYCKVKKKMIGPYLDISLYKNDKNYVWSFHIETKLKNSFVYVQYNYCNQNFYRSGLRGIIQQMEPLSHMVIWSKIQV